MIVAAVRAYGAAELVGVSCIADGHDAWFAEAVVEHGGRLEVVVPAAGHRDALPEWHHAAFGVLLEKASATHVTGMDESTPEAHMAGSEILVGLSDEPLAVWDGEPGPGVRRYGGRGRVRGASRHPGAAPVAGGRHSLIQRPCGEPTDPRQDRPEQPVTLAA